jgi:opacity protein-like surface antigen
MNKKHLLTVVAASAILLGVNAARAADLEPVAAPPGWYVSLFGGVSWLDDVKTDYEYDGYEGTYHADVSTDTGFIVGGAIGTHVMDDLRVELEVAYSENDADRIDYSAPAASDYKGDASGQFGILTFMANIWYDVPLSEALTPYIGGGAGVAIVDADSGYKDNSNYDPIFDSSEAAFAFQLGAGLRWHVAENIALDVGYRFRGIDGPTFAAKETDPNYDTSDYDAKWLWNQNVIAGISFGF